MTVATEQNETLQDAGKAVAAWVADGTPNKEPVTVETPAAEVPPVVEEKVAPVVEEAGTVEGGDVEPTPIPKFVGRVGDDDFEVPGDFLVPIKNGKEIEYIKISELQERGMRQSDYTKKTTEVSRQRKDLDRVTRDAAANRATLDAREVALKDRESKLHEIQNDPEKLAEFNDHMDLYKSNADYRKTVDKALRVDELEAQNTAIDEANHKAAVGEAVETIAGWLVELGGQDEYANVDPERVRVTYAAAIQNGTAQIDQGVLKTYFDAEADAMTKLIDSSPLRREMDELKARVAKQEEAAGAETHNAGTQHAISRAKSPNVKPAGSAPGGETQKAERFGIHELQDRTSAWIAAGKQ